MAGLIHIAEVAAILALAYVIGWAIGYVAHRVLAREPAVAAAIPAERIAAVTVASKPDVPAKAPVIESVPSDPPPSAPLKTPAAEPVVAVEASAPAPVQTVPVEVPAPQPEPSPVAEPGPEVPGLTPLVIPVTPPPPPMLIEPVPERRPPPPFEPLPPPPAPEPDVVLTATPASKPGVAWSGEVRGKTPEPIERPAPLAPVEEDPFGLPPENVALALDLGPVGPDSTYREPVLPPAAESPPIVDVVAEPQAPAPEPTPAPAPVLEEDSAMRAIEGGWSRVKARAMSGAPELSDVGAAVAAAQSAVEQVLARAGIDAAPAGETVRPKGLPRPRLGQKDDLKRINGLGALDESTLNNLGVFHFDQIAGWSEPQVLWMEDHVFARGRIHHENWQQQARELVAT
jgi:predicted flap endonuclease-1-like 5' DNA nuclease